MTEEQVFEDSYLRGERKVNQVSVHGTEYPNLEAAVRALDPVASSATIARWIEAGVSPEDAFAKIPNPGYANGIIYLIEHVASGMQYVGLTIVSIEERWRRHIAHASMNRIKTHQSLHAAIRKHGPESFTIRQIDQGVSKSDLEGKERYWIENSAHSPRKASIFLLVVLVGVPMDAPSSLTINVSTAFGLRPSMLL